MTNKEMGTLAALKKRLLSALEITVEMMSEDRTLDGLDRVEADVAVAVDMVERMQADRVAD